MSYTPNAITLVDRAVNEMIGRGDMSDGECQVNCVLSAMVRLMAAGIPESADAAVAAIYAGIAAEVADNQADAWRPRV